MKKTRNALLVPLLFLSGCGAETDPAPPPSSPPPMPRCAVVSDDNLNPDLSKWPPFPPDAQDFDFFAGRLGVNKDTLQRRGRIVTLFCDPPVTYEEGETNAALPVVGIGSCAVLHVVHPTQPQPGDTFSEITAVCLAPTAVV